MVKNPQLKKKVRLVVGSFAIVGFLYSVSMISYKLYDHIASKESYNQIQSIYYNNPSTENKSKSVNLNTTDQDLDLNLAPVQENNHIKIQNIKTRFTELLKINRDTVGWLMISNTQIDYPVVQGVDNKYYLDHSFEHKKSYNGAIFMDYRNDAVTLDQNTILYGHHMKDGSMFKHLVKYQDEKFFKENRTITFDSLGEDRAWEVFSVYVTDTQFYYIQPNFESNQSYEDFLKTIIEKSKYSTNIQLTSTDNILTLSTCSYVYNDARLVVHAKLLGNQ